MYKILIKNESRGLWPAWDEYGISFFQLIDSLFLEYAQKKGIVVDNLTTTSTTVHLNLKTAIPKPNIVTLIDLNLNVAL